MLLRSSLDALAVRRAVEAVSEAEYNGNIICETRYDGPARDHVHRVRFTLAARDSAAHGARRSWSGRRLPKASWQAHRDVMAAIFDLDPTAVLVTAITTYRGRGDFWDRFEDTGDTNIGSQMHPVLLRYTAV